MTFTGIFDNANWWTITSFIFGIIAAVCIAVYTFPQLIRLLKIKNSSGISISMFILLVIGDFFFILQCFISLYGAFQDQDPTIAVQLWLGTMLPVEIANIAGFIGALLTLCIKTKNILFAKKLGITEKEYCERVAKIINLKNSEKKEIKKAANNAEAQIDAQIKKTEKEINPTIVNKKQEIKHRSFI